MDQHEVTDWLLSGDPSIRYQVYRDLSDYDDVGMRSEISVSGWGKQILDQQKKDGYWGHDYYQPKWTSTHYTLLDLMYLQIDPNHAAIKPTMEKILKHEKGKDGGLLPIGSTQKSDVCVNGMALQFLSYFRQNEEDLCSVVDFLLSQIVVDGGFNCQSNRQGCVHSSLHSTISVLEGIHQYLTEGYNYRKQELSDVKATAEEFILQHHLFRSDKTGNIIRPSFLKFHFPVRWYYDIFRALEYFAKSQKPFDNRMTESLQILHRLKTKEGVWKVAAHYPGKTHFIMEKAGQPSRWNTLRALKIIRFYADSVSVIQQN